MICEIRIPSNFKETIARKSPEVIPFIIWCSLMLRKDNISHLLYDVQLLRYKFNVVFNPLWVSTGMTVIIGVPLISWLTVTIPSDEADCLKVMEYYSFYFSYIPENNNCKAMAISQLFLQIAVHALRTVVTVFYVIVCCFFSKLLNTLSDRTLSLSHLKANVCNSSILRYLESYESVTKAMKSFENAMSFLIFLIEASDFVSIFYCFIKLDPFHQAKRESFLKNHAPAVIFHFLRALLSFLWVSLAASSLHEASKTTKEVQEKIMKEMIISDEANSKQLLRLFVVHNSPAFTLSAWGFFHFSKGMVLAAVGSILTYSLLILQIDSK
ncbi:hypothetical protein AVEN_11814-1 [Araneus ventricosus]|uniref:Gustatory receptor n=1 Tax=Araneus ventricosus TaxID=182803 RepID=A0A4Y2SWQ5_ARAVE|nr:hypothetical protein AVEN_11814-1 [Araneus ventricosus]